MPRRTTTNPPRPFRYSVQLPELMADTAHPEPSELGCYMRLLFSYWRVGPPKNDDRTLARIVGLPVKGWITTRPEIEPFFDVDREWIHWRTDDDLQAAYDAITGNRKRTQAATDARKRRNAERNDQRDVVRNDNRNDERNVFLTVSNSEDQKPLAKDKSFSSADSEVEQAVSTLESGWKEVANV